jgi:pyruvate dehydrogenase E1 component alpha subunit
MDNKWATEDQIEQINEKVRLEVEDSVKFAEESPWPDDSELLKDVYMDQNYVFDVD